MTRSVIVVLGMILALSACTSRLGDQGSLYDQFGDGDVKLAAATLQRALEQARNGQTTAWQNAASAAAGSITPTADVSCGGWRLLPRLRRDDHRQRAVRTIAEHRLSQRERHVGLDLATMAQPPEPATPDAARVATASSPGLAQSAPARLTDLSFEDWLDHAFGHEVRLQASPWYFDPDADWWDPPPGVALAYFTTLFEDPEPAFQWFADSQIAQGLTYLLSTSASGDNGWFRATLVPAVSAAPLRRGHCHILCPTVRATLHAAPLAPQRGTGRDAELRLLHGVGRVPLPCPARRPAREKCPTWVRSLAAPPDGGGDETKCALSPRMVEFLNYLSIACLIAGVLVLLFAGKE